MRASIETNTLENALNTTCELCKRVSSHIKDIIGRKKPTKTKH